ncbi:DUF1953 domain-containing protein [Stygiolobus sp. CP859M]
MKTLQSLIEQNVKIDGEYTDVLTGEYFRDSVNVKDLLRVLVKQN